MYIKLIQPRMLMRPMDTGLKVRMSPPLGLYTIVNLLRAEHTVVVQNENVEPVTYDSPDIVGLSVAGLPEWAVVLSSFAVLGVYVAILYASRRKVEGRFTLTVNKQ